jgi:hypothetical protein
MLINYLNETWILKQSLANFNSENSGFYLSKHELEKY